jgi:hypothetical protein
LLAAAKSFQTLAWVASFAELNTAFSAAKEPARIGRDGWG